jgi:tRNA(His) guanylyltransferase
MAKSKYEYVRLYELDDKLLKNVWMVVRVDGKGFHKFTSDHKFEKPNDLAALNLMNDAAKGVMSELQDIFMAYGQSDEYSFVFKRSSTLYGRRSSKIISTVCSMFTSHYLFNWNKHMKDPLMYPPSFDARVVLYPSVRDVRNYFSWRQADCHINNLYNTCFWALVQNSSMSAKEAEKRLNGTFSSDKNEILFSEFGINYNDLSEMFRKGSTIIWNESKDENGRLRKVLRLLSCDIIGDSYWDEHACYLDTSSSE